MTVTATCPTGNNASDTRYNTICKLDTIPSMQVGGACADAAVVDPVLTAAQDGPQHLQTRDRQTALPKHCHA